MRCIRCGSELSPEEMYCGECGAPRPRVPERFAETEKQFAALKARRDAGQLSDSNYEAALRALIFQDDAGKHWMLGTESGEWYRAEGQRWVRADPPLQSSIPPPKETLAVVAPPSRVKRRLSWLWIALGGAVIVTAAVCGAMYIFLSAAIPLQLKALAPTAAPRSTFPVPKEAATAVPQSAAATPSPGTTGGGFCEGMCSRVPKDGSVTIADPGLSLYLPAGWIYRQGSGNIDARSTDADDAFRLGVYWYAAPAGSTAETALRDQLREQLPSSSLSTISTDKAAVGDLAWCTGEIGSSSFYAAAVGPDAQNRVLFWFGLEGQTRTQLTLSQFKESARRSGFTR